MSEMNQQTHRAHLIRLCGLLNLGERGLKGSDDVVRAAVIVVVTIYLRITEQFVDNVRKKLIKSCQRVVIKDDKTKSMLGWGGEA